jgi:hypothetical protein
MSTKLNIAQNLWQLFYIIMGILGSSGISIIKLILKSKFLSSAGLFLKPI